MNLKDFSLVNIARIAGRAPAAFAWTSVLHESCIRIPQLFKGFYRPLYIIHLWGYGLSKIMGIRIHERNQRQGEMGDLIIANHMGFLDIPVLLSYYPAVFIIKMEMRKVLYFGRGLEEEGHVFVDRGNKASGKQAAQAMAKVLEDGDRIIVFPEGKASPGAKRHPFKSRSFAEAQRLGKKVEVCIIDYLPNRKDLQWDTSMKMIPQLVKLFGRKHSDVSVEFFPAEYVEGDTEEYAKKLHDKIENRLKEYDEERERYQNSDN